MKIDSFKIFGLPILQIKTEWKRTPVKTYVPGQDNIIFQQMSLDYVFGT